MPPYTPAEAPGGQSNGFVELCFGRTADNRSSVVSLLAETLAPTPRRAVDLWITPIGYPQPHRPSNQTNRYEQNRETVTHVVGQICHLSRRLLIGMAGEI